MQKDIVSEPLDTKLLHGDVLSLVRGLLEKDPSKRLGSQGGVEAIRAHPFFKDVDWNDVMQGKYRYEKQFMLVELTRTNFNTEHIKEADALIGGIDIEAESCCQSEKCSREC